MITRNAAADPAAEFAVALSLYNGLAERSKIYDLNLSEAFGGGDQFMRECARIGMVFESWACVNVAFEELTDVWPYLLEDQFLASYEEAHGVITQDTAAELSNFNETSCPAIWKILKTKQL